MIEFYAEMFSFDNLMKHAGSTKEEERVMNEVGNFTPSQKVQYLTEKIWALENLKKKHLKEMGI